ncbi:MAG: type III secretion system gatekeeper subunit SctW [Candidatus Accumulibacter sp.]|jgi:type III secretion protein W|nr:type III secretion system gatekeeper subunit SctW [Accumulibacter sp.]
MADFSIQHQVSVSPNMDTANAQLAARSGGEAVGSLAGYQVKAADDPLASLADAAEELTFGVDNTKELTLKERKARTDNAANFLEKVEKYQALMEKAAERDKLESLYAFLKNNRNPQAALAKAKEWAGSDPALAWAVLRKARETLKDEAPAVALEAIDAALEMQEKNEGPAIRAGIQGTLEAENHPALGEPFALGETYRQVVCDFHENLDDLFSFVLEKYGEKDFDAALDFLFRSLACDLESDQRSHDKAHLETVGAGLGRARVLNGAHTLTVRFLERCRSVHGMDCAWTPMSFLKDVLALKKNRFLAARDIDGLLEKAKAPDIEHEVLFLQELLSTSRNFSTLLFENTEERIKFIGAVQESVDAAIVREDEMLALSEKEDDR